MYPPFEDFDILLPCSSHIRWVSWIGFLQIQVVCRALHQKVINIAPSSWLLDLIKPTVPWIQSPLRPDQMRNPCRAIRQIVATELCDQFCQVRFDSSVVKLVANLSRRIIIESVVPETSRTERVERFGAGLVAPRALAGSCDTRHSMGNLHGHGSCRHGADWHAYRASNSQCCPKAYRLIQQLATADSHTLSELTEISAGSERCGQWRGDSTIARSVAGPLDALVPNALVTAVEEVHDRTSCADQHCIASVALLVQSRGIHNGITRPRHRGRWHGRDRIRLQPHPMNDHRTTVSPNLHSTVSAHSVERHLAVSAYFRNLAPNPILT